MRNTRFALRLIQFFKDLLQIEYVQHVQGQVHHKIVPFNNLNTYLHNDTSDTEVNTNIWRPTRYRTRHLFTNFTTNEAIGFQVLRQDTNAGLSR
jgi:hypothetical protein